MLESGGALPRSLKRAGAFSDDGFLGGRLRILQPEQGFRAAIDSVLLPAAVSLAGGVHILDAGLGAGVGALSLLAREPRFAVCGLEIDQGLCDLAAENAHRNAMKIEIRCADLVSVESVKKFDQVMTNPPYHSESVAPASPHRQRSQANHLSDKEGSASLERWIAACLAHLHGRGTLTLIYKADRLNEILAILATKVCAITVLLLVPRVGLPPKRVILRARLGVAGGVSMLPAFVLHGEHEKYTAAAEAVLRHAAAIDLGP